MMMIITSGSRLDQSPFHLGSLIIHSSSDSLSSSRINVPPPYPLAKTRIADHHILDSLRLRHDMSHPSPKNIQPSPLPQKASPSRRAPLSFGSSLMTPPAATKPPSLTWMGDAEKQGALIALLIYFPSSFFPFVSCSLFLSAEQRADSLREILPDTY